MTRQQIVDQINALSREITQIERNRGNESAELQRCNGNLQAIKNQRIHEKDVQGKNRQRLDHATWPNRRDISRSKLEQMDAGVKRRKENRDKLQQKLDASSQQRR
ncbi:hypothetical protein CKM354_000762200 [Cercospora kikuchii]|uniref:Uncharacterized protein n=1 Tax=Cercospora kikuchii TaxID=84275 RepID=A0A9P3CHD2_9PEZI|nr:uncharacterized protein CKM354_000762200 [Cercospora kikuchii]GIZ44424.1 hypothetical protein CKM354_000762200 [Cercospora kikuchii]